jgi:hypothetical protein
MELKRLRKLTIKVVAVSGKMPNNVKLDTTIRPKPNPLKVCSSVASPNSAKMGSSVSKSITCNSCNVCDLYQKCAITLVYDITTKIKRLG